MKPKIEPLKLSLQQIAEMTGESLPTLHCAIKAGDLESFLVGRRRFCRPAAVAKWIDMLEKASNSGKPVCYRSRAAEAGRAA